MAETPIIDMLKKRKPLLTEQKPVRDMLLKNTGKVLSAHGICQKAIDTAVNEAVSVPAKAVGDGMVNKVRKLRGR